MNSRVNFQTSAAELEEEARQNGKKGKKDKSKAADAKEADLPQEVHRRETLRKKP